MSVATIVPGKNPFTYNPGDNYISVYYANDAAVAKSYTLTGRYDWNGGVSTQTVTFTVTIVDKCYSDLTPHADVTMPNYTITSAGI